MKLQPFCHMNLYLKHEKRISNEDLGKFHADLEAHLNFSKFCEPAKCSVIFIQSLAYLTPIVFLILPRITTPDLSPPDENEKTNQCDIGCEGE